MDLVKGNKSKVEALDMIFLRAIEGKLRGGTTRNYIFREEPGLQNLLIELEENTQGIYSLGDDFAFVMTHMKHPLLCPVLQNSSYMLLLACYSSHCI
jgi:hypothetical protein